MPNDIIKLPKDVQRSELIQEMGNKMIIKMLMKKTNSNVQNPCPIMFPFSHMGQVHSLEKVECVH